MLSLLQRGQPLAPPAGFDLWRVAVLSAFIRCPLAVPMCATSNPFASGGVRAVQVGDTDLCADLYCTATVATSFATLGVPPQLLTGLVTAVNATCNGLCVQQPYYYNSGSGSGRWTADCMLCPPSCMPQSMPNLTLRLGTGSDGTTGPMYIDFTLTGADYAMLVNTTAFQGTAWRIMVSEYTNSVSGEMDFMLGLPFIQAYYTIFDANANRCTWRPFS